MSNTLKFGNGQWATKVGSTLAYNDEGGNFKPLPFNFTRSTSATRVNKDGLIEMVTNNEPRIDFLNDSNGALLLEPTRTNSITYSNDFSNAYWSPNSNALRSLSSNLSPDGTANAYRVEAVTGTQVGHVGTTTIGTTITHSIWVRRISGSTTFNMVDVNNINTSVNITSDWQRFSITSTATSIYLRSYFRTTALGDVVEIYGAQAEIGSYATSYIPTQGATATRVADVCINAGNDQVFNDSEGVLYAEISALANDLTNRAIALSDGTANNGIQIFYYNVSNRIRCRVYSGGVLQNTINIIGYTITDTHKIALKWESGFMSVFIDGVINGTALAITSTPVGLDRLNLDLGQGSSDFYGNTKDIRVYNTALTDQELINLTTI
jgi:hypothetical protein